MFWNKKNKAANSGASPRPKAKPAEAKPAKRDFSEGVGGLRVTHERGDMAPGPRAVKTTVAATEAAAPSGGRATSAPAPSTKMAPPKKQVALTGAVTPQKATPNKARPKPFKITGTSKSGGRRTVPDTSPPMPMPTVAGRSGPRPKQPLTQEMLDDLSKLSRGD